MPISRKTRERVGLPPKATEAEVQEALAAALGVQSSAMIVEDRTTLSKAEEELLQSKALTVEDDPWNQLPNERRTNLIRPTYNPVQLATLCVQNNTLAQCLDAFEVNIDGTGFEVERKDNDTASEEEEDDNIEPLKEMFHSINVSESFTSVRRKVRRDRHTYGNGYMEVLRNEAGEITLVNHIDAKLVYMVKLDDPVEVERTIKRGGKEQKVRMLVRERRYAMMIGNKVRYFREFGSSREIDADTGEWMGPARATPDALFKGKPMDPKFKATGDQDKLPPEPGTPGARAPTAATPADGARTDKPVAEMTPEERRKRMAVAKATEPKPVVATPPQAGDDPTRQVGATPKSAGARGTEIIHFKDRPDISTPYGVPVWINQVPSVLGSRKAEELNLEYFNHGGMPPVMIFVQGGQLSQQSKDLLNTYLSGAAKTKLRAVVADVYSTGGDLTSTSQVKVNVERFGGDQRQDSMFEGYDERCSARVRGAFRLPPLFTGDTGDYTFATAYASYVVAEAQVFKPERELFDEVVNNTLMRELAPDYVFRSLPLTVVDVAVKLQALGLVKDITDTKTFVDEVNEIGGLNLTFKEPADPMGGFGMPGAGDPFAPAGEDEEPGAPGGFPPAKGAFPPGNPVGVPKVPTPKPAKPLPSNFAKANRERIAKMGDDVFTQLADDWAAHLAGDKQFDAGAVNFMKSCIDAFHPQMRKLFNAYVGMRLAPGAKYDPDGVADLMACAGDALCRH